MVRHTGKRKKSLFYSHCKSDTTCFQYVKPSSSLYKICSNNLFALDISTQEATLYMKIHQNQLVNKRCTYKAHRQWVGIRWFLHTPKPCSHGQVIDKSINKIEYLNKHNKLFRLFYSSNKDKSTGKRTKKIILIWTLSLKYCKTNSTCLELSFFLS